MVSGLVFTGLRTVLFLWRRLTPAPFACYAMSPWRVNAPKESGRLRNQRSRLRREVPRGRVARLLQVIDYRLPAHRR